VEFIEMLKIFRVRLTKIKDREKSIQGRAHFILIDINEFSRPELKKAPR